MGTMREPEVDQVWRRKSDRRLCRVLEVSGRKVQYQGSRRQWKLIRAFVREFEYVGRAGAPSAAAPISEREGQR